MCIRKELNVPHGLRIEGAERVINRYLILDDLIESGSTIERIIRIINREAHYKRERPECVGILLWRDPFIGPFKYKDQEIPVYSVK